MAQSLSKVRQDRNYALLRAAEVGDIEQCKLLFYPDHAPPASEDNWDGSADVWFADELLGWDALHYAADQGHADIIKLLLKHGALWNAVDKLGFTAAEVAWSKNATKCYALLFEEGVRKSFLTDLLMRKAQLHASVPMNAQDSTHQEAHFDGASLTLVPGTQNEVAADNPQFLQSKLFFEQDERGEWRCMDVDKNVVMAEWESDIMQASAEALCEAQKPAFSVLNVGFGLGIIDQAIQRHNPGRHVIIEPHPDVLAFIKAQGWDLLPNVEILPGRWEDYLLPTKDSDGEDVYPPYIGEFDAVYFDTYSQDYQATNPFFYQVFTRVSELDLRDIGLVTSWKTLYPTVEEASWQGVKRKYWSLDQYYLPISHMQHVG
ncbi:type IV protein arginine methyltransferase [Malassezia vespertilionis]|uniref:Rmt2p n=1 Tax=Malassezia vespertilionis TaxID=2020962 RepID=A0A2N1JGF6_9BASI|nr:type IV protein arginine methyltransferase [Malassezia vespertilionis]PKI85637.1 Rmt2p [Malassezia vespertilionis]WFD05392.1 type IV protein arginine methyltransferase [Malassezia vespertilionis]